MNFPFLPERASTYANDVDQIGLVLTLLTVFFTVLVMTLLVVFAVRYRRGSRYSRANRHHHSLVLELAWSIIPLFMALGVFAWSVIPYSRVYNPPANAEEIFVIGKRWMWHLEHTNGIRENNELHVSVGRPYKLTMISQDVIHGFYVPEFRIKRDVLPGAFNTVWFQATKPGRYHLFCTEYCGTNHSEMGGWVYVMPPSDYATWLKSGSSGVQVGPPMSVEQEGQDLFTQLACGNCHKNEDSVRAPSLIGIFGKERRLVGNKTVTADDNYLRNVIRHPENYVLEGYGSVATMPAYTPDQITEEQVHNLIAYIKSMGGAADPHAGSTATNTGSGGRKPPFVRAEFPLADPSRVGTPGSAASPTAPPNPSTNSSSSPAKSSTPLQSPTQPANGGSNTGTGNTP